MPSPYRWGDATPANVIAMKARRQRRADAAEYFRLTGDPLLDGDLVGLRFARAGWLRKSPPETPPICLEPRALAFGERGPL